MSALKAFANDPMFHSVDQQKQQQPQSGLYEPSLEHLPEHAPANSPEAGQLLQSLTEPLLGPEAELEPLQELEPEPMDLHAEDQPLPRLSEIRNRSQSLYMRNTSIIDDANSYRQFNVDVNELIADEFPNLLVGKRTCVRFIFAYGCTWVCAADILGIYGYNTNSDHQDVASRVAQFH